LSTPGVQLVGAGKAMMGLSGDYGLPTPLSLNVLEKFRVAINAKPKEAEEEEHDLEDAPAPQGEAPGGA
jgi:hypothetical protein